MSSSFQQHQQHRRPKAVVKRTTSVNQLHKKIRDATRLLQRPKPIAADVRMEIERAKMAYEQDLAGAKAEKRRQKMIRRYHKVRFFERQKATRRLNQLRKKLGSCSEEKRRRRLELQVHEAEVDLSYTLYYPLDRKYVALYAADKKGGDGVDEPVEEEKEEGESAQQRVKPPLWKEVERRMEMGGLEELRNGGGELVPGGGGGGSASSSKMARMKDTTRSTENGDDRRKMKADKRAQHQSDEEDDEESDGGFFE